ncbi:MAG TPA: nuclear transport factor 2 family protein [Devosiaceae bacterium]|nr:nuclear transport factor 2 family protein [Devosiaceae bacterium]
MNDRDEIVASALARLSGLMRAADPAIAAEFEPDALLVGSEPGEIARGRQEIAALFGDIFRTGRSVWWEWHTVDSQRSRDGAWLFAEGLVVLASSGVENRLPYRLSGALVERNGAWKWQLFHGSEPKA